MKDRNKLSLCWICLVGLFAFLCGCHAPQSAATDAKQDLPPRTRTKLVVLDELKVPGKHAEKNLGAYFILVDEDELSFFENYFKDNVPKVELSAGKDKPFKNLARDDGGGVIDSVTRKPGIMFGFQKVEINGDQARVEVVESESLSAISVHTFELRLQNGKWTILIHSRKALS